MGKPHGIGILDALTQDATGTAWIPSSGIAVGKTITQGI
jgi:hypothetical protein